jgi:hypothetical protein
MILKTNLLLICLYPFSIYCQDTVRITFNSKLNLTAPIENFTFQFLDDNSNHVLHGKDINQYVFKHPGYYKIVATKQNTPIKYFTKVHCDHSSKYEMPPYIILYVDSIRIKYLGETISLSKPICVDQLCSDHFLEISADMENYFRTPISLTNTTIYAAGIGTELYATLEPQYTRLNAGKQTLKFKLHGKVNLSTYIQFNFRDNIGTYTPIGLNSKISKCKYD